jgi:hypothetical protein
MREVLPNRRACDKAPDVSLRWSAGTDEMHFASGKGPAPAVHDVVPGLVSGSLAISVNPRFMLRLLEGLDVARVMLSATDRGSAVRIDAGPDRYAVLTPMRVPIREFIGEAA